MANPFEKHASVCVECNALPQTGDSVLCLPCYQVAAAEKERERIEWIARQEMLLQKATEREALQVRAERKARALRIPPELRYVQ